MQRSRGAGMVDDEDPVWGPSGPPVRNQPLRVVSDRPPLLLKPARLPDPTTIPPRQWLLGTQLLRGNVTVLVAPGGTGKTVYAMMAALSLVTHQKLLGLHVWERVNAAIFNEDPLEELERRMAAIMLCHRIDDTEVEGRLFLNSFDDRSLTMAERGSDGFSVVHPDEAALIEQILANNIGVLVVDPFAESHSLEENSNPDMIKAAAAWRRIARATGCAIFLVHHVRKGIAEGSIDAARGAKGLTDSARVGLVMASMSADEAKALGVPAEDRFRFVRVDDAKVNLSPRIDKARWFELQTQELKNGTEQYPSGDHVAALVPWSPPQLFSQISVEQVNQVMDAIADGVSPGMLYASNQKGAQGRWAGDPLRRVVDLTEEQAQQMINAWVKSGLLYLEDFRNPKTRRVVSGLRVDDSKRPT